MNYQTYLSDEISQLELEIEDARLQLISRNEIGDKETLELFLDTQDWLSGMKYIEGTEVRELVALALSTDSEFSKFRSNIKRYSRNWRFYKEEDIGKSTLTFSAHCLSRDENVRLRTTISKQLFDELGKLVKLEERKAELVWKRKRQISEYIITPSEAKSKMKQVQRDSSSTINAVLAIIIGLDVFLFLVYLFLTTFPLY